MSLAKYFDHTNLHPDASTEDIIKLCKEAKEYAFYAVCIHPCYIELAKKELEGSDVKVATVVGFPLGQNTSETKAFEAKDAIALGADEVDMVLNYAYLKEGKENLCYEDVLKVREASRGAILKVILETSELSDEQKKRACLICKEAGADFVKTSTGFSKAGATTADVSLMKEHFGGMVKASGGVRTLEDAEVMVRAGADRIGASSSVSVVKEER